MAARFLRDTLFTADLEKTEMIQIILITQIIHNDLLLSIGTVKAHVPNNVVHKIQEQLRSFLLNR